MLLLCVIRRDQLLLVLRCLGNDLFIYVLIFIQSLKNHISRPYITHGSIFIRHFLVRNLRCSKHIKSRISSTLNAVYSVAYLFGRHTENSNHS